MKYDELIAKKKSTPFPVKTGVDCVVKELDTTNRTVKLVANTFNFFDYDCDILLKGCANRSIQHRGAKSSAVDKIVHLLHHDYQRPVGKSMLESEEEIDGKSVIYCESFLPETADGEDTLINYQAGIYNQHSIGLKYIDLEYIERNTQAWDKALAFVLNPDDMNNVGYAWLVKEIALREYSTVVFGANKLTPFLGTKSENKIEIADVISKKLSILALKATRAEIKNKDLFNIEVLQLQQMILELANMSSLKESPKNGPNTDSTTIKLAGFSEKINFNFKNSMK